MVLTSLTAVFLVLYGALLFFYFTHWKKLPEYKPELQTPSAFVSVVIAARNEEKTLPHVLNDLAKQSYPEHLFEVIIVDDYSTDNTAALAKTFPGNVRLILPDAPPEASSKKAAIASGIKRAKGELIVITDADCRVGNDWIATTVSFHQQKGAVFIAAPVRFTPNGSLLQTFQTLDFITLQGITAASVSANVHTMCNGANLAYTKQAFEDVNGFAGIAKIATGDDMLLMHKIWKRHPQNVFYLKSNDAIATTEPAKTWTEFIMQRRRWASKTLVYDDRRIIAVLAFVLLFNLLFFVLLIAAFVNKNYWLHVLIFLVGKTIIEWPFVSSVASFFGQQKLMRRFALLQPLHIFYTVFVGVLSQFGKYEWKGRRTK